MIRLVLPYPVSANRYWRSYTPRGMGRAIVCVSPEAKAYKREVQLIAATAGLDAPLDGLIAVELALCPAAPADWKRRATADPGWADKLRCIDLDNSIKVMIDALQGVAFADDKQVRKITAERAGPTPGGSVIVQVQRLGA